MSELSPFTKRMYEVNWNYVKQFISDIKNVEKTISELNAVEKTKTGVPCTLAQRKNYLSAIMNQVRDDRDLHDKYRFHMKHLKEKTDVILEKQEGTKKLREKLDNLTWKDIICYKNKILSNPKISEENKLLVRLYTELDNPVRNDFNSIRVFIDEGRPVDWIGNCIMLTKSPITIARKKLRVKPTNKIIYDTDDEPESDAVVMPIRNMIWLQDFKTSKHRRVPDIIQDIPTELANDIMRYCETYKTNILFDATAHALSKRIIHMFYQVSERNIGINVLRHLSIMNEYDGVPLNVTRKQAAHRMGHSVSTQELYRIKL